MIGVAFDYASPSALVSEREHALLGFAADARRPVRFNGRIKAELPLVRFALRAFGEAIWSRDEWGGEGDWAAGVLDPIITVHPDRIFFEAFSGDQSAYAALLLDPSLLFYLAVFFVIGYVVNASLMVAVGAAVNEMKEAQSLMMPIMLTLMAPWILAQPIVG